MAWNLHITTAVRTTTPPKISEDHQSITATTHNRIDLSILATTSPITSMSIVAAIGSNTYIIPKFIKLKLAKIHYVKEDIVRRHIKAKKKYSINQMQR